jgi:hypothetical protein
MTRLQRLWLWARRLGRRAEAKVGGVVADRATTDWYVVLAAWRADELDDRAAARVAGLIAWRHPSVRPWEDCDDIEWSRLVQAADELLKADAISGGAWTALRTKGTR